MTELYWPNEHRFIDWERDFEADEPGTYDVPDDAEEQYLERGWREDEDADSAAEPEDEPEDEAEAEPEADEVDEVDEAGETDETDEAGDESDQNLRDMEYDELQSLAKENDIPANQSKRDLIEALGGG